MSLPNESNRLTGFVSVREEKHITASGRFCFSRTGGRSSVKGLNRYMITSERRWGMLQKIKLNKPEDVREFVRAANKCDFDIDVSYDRVMVDAKSLMGILAMDLANCLTVICHGEDKEFKGSLKKWAVN